jgi:hypothetical protein
MPRDAGGVEPTFAAACNDDVMEELRAILEQAFTDADQAGMGLAVDPCRRRPERLHLWRSRP